MGLVLFVDMDAFYASCELLRHPELKGKPFVVGTADEANKIKGVVETCSYEAKKLEMHSAMAVALAMKIKKDIAYVASDHGYYEEISLKVMGLLRGYGLKTEVISVDEAALDLGGMGYAGAEDLARKIKKEIGETVGIPCTVGISSGKVLAKMVCDSAKPNGLRVVSAEQIKDFMADKEVDKIPGVGEKTAERLNELEIKTIGELANADPIMLAHKMGSFGPELHRLANGNDDSRVVEAWKVLSIGRERTLNSRTTDLDDIDRMIDELSDEVIAEVRKQGVSFKTVTAKARYFDFTEKLKSKSFTNYSDDLELLKSTSHTLIRELVGEKALRKVGVRVSSLNDSKGQKRLF